MRDDDILTVGQVAAQLHVTPQTVRAWIESGKLRGGRVGKAYMILRGDVYAMIEQAAAENERPAEPRLTDVVPDARRVRRCGAPRQATGRWRGPRARPRERVRRQPQRATCALLPPRPSRFHDRHG